MPIQEHQVLKKGGEKKLDHDDPTNMELPISEMTIKYPDNDRTETALRKKMHEYEERYDQSLKQPNKKDPTLIYKIKIFDLALKGFAAELGYQFIRDRVETELLNSGLIFEEGWFDESFLMSREYINDEGRNLVGGTGLDFTETGGDPRELVKSARTFKELDTLINRISKSKIAAMLPIFIESETWCLKDTINAVRKNMLPLDKVPEAYGLRKKVKELLLSDPLEK